MCDRNYASSELLYVSVRIDDESFRKPAAKIVGSRSRPRQQRVLPLLLVNPVPEFDAAFYLSRHPDVAAAGIDPFEHYLLYGFREGRDPWARPVIQQPRQSAQRFGLLRSTQVRLVGVAFLIERDDVEKRRPQIDDRYGVVVALARCETRKLRRSRVSRSGHPG